jgi:hypothetical protein
MASKIRDMLVLYLPSEWKRAGIAVGAASPGPPGVPPGRPPGPDPEFRDFDLMELRMIVQLLLARLGGPITLGEMEPRSVTEVMELESRLTGALEELRALRATLEKAP